MWAASCLASCCAACACDACRTVVSSISRRSVRIAYCSLFALSLIVSWILREVAAPLMEKLPWINHFHKTPDREWFETDDVLRVSLGNFQDAKGVTVCTVSRIIKESNVGGAALCRRWSKKLCGGFNDSREEIIFHQETV
ncbi:hypothetical protein Bca52824_022308 [Brassica carinata]|uniref:Uncharacterized protein n=1 Tax=Brassica carinata TaxID=52824 RepID=A0A8X7VGB6_BRACI|nr:hypothetical protein Bca52824_022308 [Brassica carinata]